MVSKARALDGRLGRILVVLGMLTVVGVGFLAFQLSQDDGDDSAGTTPAETSEQTIEDPSVADLSEVDQTAAKEHAEHVVSVYTEWTYKDSGPTGWLKRLAPLITDSLHHELHETFENDPTADQVWEDEIVPNKASVGTKILDVTVTKGTDTAITCVVRFERTVHGDVDLEFPKGPQSVAVSVTKEDGGWLATRITPTESG